MASSEQILGSERAVSHSPLRWSASINQLINGGPKLVFVDLDGTLVDSIPDLANALNQTLELLGLASLPIEQITTFVGNGADLLVRRGLAQGDESLVQNLDEDTVAEARAIFDQAYLSCLTRATGIYPGVTDFLSELNCGQIPAILVTNKPRIFTIPLLRSLGWSDTFEHVVCGDDYSHKKPSPIPLLKALDQFNKTREATEVLRSDQCIMLGDSISDFKAAAAAEMISIAVTYGYNHGQGISQSDGDLQIDNLMQCLELSE